MKPEYPRVRARPSCPDGLVPYNHRPISKHGSALHDDNTPHLFIASNNWFNQTYQKMEYVNIHQRFLFGPCPIFWQAGGAASHRGAVERFWLHFVQAVMSSIFITVIGAAKQAGVL